MPNIEQKSKTEPYRCIIVIEGKIEMAETLMATNENEVERTAIATLTREKPSLSDSQIGKADIYIHPFAKRM